MIEAKVTAVKPDGKLDLTLREKAYIQMDTDAEKILELLDSYAGVLPFSEKASPEVIKRETGLSKAAFKRAIGHLYNYTGWWKNPQEFRIMQVKAKGGI